VIVLGGSEEQELIDRTPLYNYYFAWGEHPELAPLRWAAGRSTITRSTRTRTTSATFAAGENPHLAYRAIGGARRSPSNYGGRPDCPDPVWFDVADEEG
jgi:hypothetical protein